MIRMHDEHDEAILTHIQGNEEKKSPIFSTKTLVSFSIVIGSGMTSVAMHVNFFKLRHNVYNQIAL